MNLCQVNIVNSVNGFNEVNGVNEASKVNRVNRANGAASKGIQTIFQEPLRYFLFVGCFILKLCLLASKKKKKKAKAT